MASISLPNELLAHIVSFLDRSSLKATRETSRILSQFATPWLFNTLYLFPDEDSYEAVDYIINHAALKKMVKKVYVNTCEDDYDDDDEEEVELTEDFKDRIAIKIVQMCKAPSCENAAGLRALRLSIVTEHDEAVPENDLDYSEPHDFFAQLPSVWLKPSASSLEHLSLSCDIYFGFYPNLELSDVHFPHLKSLSFGNYCFVRDSQLEWILSHAATLTDLYFDNCAILFDVGLYAIHLDRVPFKKSEMERRRGQQLNYYHSYDKRWHNYFDSFRTELPHLRHCRFGSNDWSEGVPFEKEAKIKISLRENRYMACYDADYVEEDYGLYGHMEWEKEAPKCDEKDKEALRLLLEKTGQGSKVRC